MAYSKTFAIGEVLTAADLNEHLVHRVPTAGAAYDTGWINITNFASGWGAGNIQPQVRRIGYQVKCRGRVSPTSSVSITNSYQSVCTLPFAPPTTASVALALASVAVLDANIGTTGALSIRSISGSVSSYSGNLNIDDVFWWDD